MMHPPKGIRRSQNMEKDIAELYNEIEKLYGELDNTKHELAKHICSHIAHFPRQNNAQEVFDT